MSELDPSIRLDDEESRPGVSRSLARSAGVIGATTLTSRVLGLVREQVMAYFFGASNAVDAFNVAFRIPNLVRDLFAEGAMSAAFVPTFTRTVARDGRDAAWRLGHSVVTAVLIATAIVVVLGIVFADPLVRLLAGDYALVPGKIELTVLLTRTMMPFLMLVATAAVAMGMLNSLDRFFVPALAPAVFNVCSIVTTLALLPVLERLGIPMILAMAIGVLVGGVGQVAIQWPVLRREGYRYRPMLDLKARGLREVLLLMGPGTLGARGHASERLREHVARHRRRHRRGVVAQLRVPPDVSAAGTLRRVDRHGLDSAHRAPGRCRGPRRTQADHLDRGLDDARVDGAGNARARRARAADRRAAVRARTLHAGRHRGHRRRA